MQGKIGRSTVYKIAPLGTYAEMGAIDDISTPTFVIKITVRLRRTNVWKFNSTFLTCILCVLEPAVVTKICPTPRMSDQCTTSWTKPLLFVVLLLYNTVISYDSWFIYNLLSYRFECCKWCKYCIIYNEYTLSLKLV